MTPGYATPVVNHAREAGHAVGRLALRQVRRGALIVLAVASGMSALVAVTYQRTVSDALDAAALAALAENPAVRTLFGEPVALDTPGGFAVWRTGTVLAVLVSVWGLLAATRITRGEEEGGRWDLVLAGPLGLPAVVRRHLAVLLAAMAVVATGVTGALLAAGTPPVGAVLHGAGIALAGMFAVAVATLAAQVFPTRSGASGAATAVLGLALLARMVGDGVPALGWLRWLSPYGLLALSRPYHDDWPAPLAVLAVAVVAVAAAASALAGRRDAHGGLLVASAGRRPRRWLLGSVEAFAVRRLLRPLAGWSAGVAAYFLLIGVLATEMTAFLADNPRFATLAADAGFAGLGSVRGYAAALFALLAVPVGAFAALRVAAFAAAENDRRLTALHAQPVTRVRLVGAEVAATLAGVAVLLAVAGVATWCGAAIVDADLPLTAALAGTGNVAPIVVLCLGAGILALGWTPRAVLAVGVLPGAGGFLLQVVADSTGAPPWVGGLSPFRHLAAVPDVDPNIPACVVMTVLAVLVGVAGVARYRRRDLAG
ncbi:ABC transporter permease [Micromonospora endolithica]|uniref:Polyketide antibiotic transporter n=1 Tax=Micromonospora endolithica TaxID=230091 RepID=A0A3A9YYJ3_9ACTN|nr:polyketide antibiotic transporter [Micromonospora endolithica]RKN40286.1 polyketide antibiotic transporter [Micromonospora endolithica]TWJ22608.1 ABC-2 type transport system permease protein [Micromonospora endolithica]